MIRTPDEIKKGLEHAAIDCRDAHECDKTCAYYKECTNFYYEITEVPCTMLCDALALIQQLQADNDEKDQRIRQLEAERDAAVKSLRGRCFECKHNKTSVCLLCSKDKTLKYWQWRGVQKEE